mgnify:FL=1
MKFVKEDLENMLREHKKNEAKILEIDIKLEEYGNRLEYAGTVYEETDKEIIESLQLSSNVSEVPSGKTNKISNVTEQTAINYPKERIHINREDRIFLESKLRELEKEKDRLNKQVVRVKNLLTILGEKKRFVINEFYIEGEKSDWKRVAKEYENQFPRYLSVKQLQNIRDVALKDMLEVLNT